MGACLSAPKPAADGPSVSARSARTFGVAPVQTAKSDVESSGEMVEVPLDTPVAAASGAGKGSGFGSFLQAKVTVDARSADGPRDAPPEPSEGANGALVPERGRIDQALVDDMDAAAANALAGGDDEDADPGSSADRVEARARAEAAAREQDVSLVLSGDPSDEETFSDSGEEPPEADEDDSYSEYESDASSARDDEGDDARRAGPSENATSSEATDDALAVEPAATAAAPSAPGTDEPAANASDDAPGPLSGTPERRLADSTSEDDFEDSLGVVDMGPVSDSEPNGSEFDSAASESSDGDGGEDGGRAAETDGETEPSTEVSAEVSPEEDALARDAKTDRSESLGETRNPTEEASEESRGAREDADAAADDGADDAESSYASSETSYASSAYGDEDDRFDADAGPRVASTVEAFGSTVDATVTEVRARSKHSPPPTPRVRGAAEASEPRNQSSRGATPRSARSGGVPSSSRSGADSARESARDSARSGASEGWTSVVVLYVTSVSAVRRTAGQCQRVRQTLANLGVEFLERDVSMATAYKDELARRLVAARTKGGGVSGEDDANDARHSAGTEKEGKTAKTGGGKPPTSAGGSSSASELVVPCLFVDDAFAGSGEALDASANDGSLRALLEERGRVGRARAEKDACAACAGWKLVICDRCDGSMRWRMTDEKTGAVLGERRCPWCNEVGMRECEACVPAFARTSGRGGSRGGR